MLFHRVAFGVLAIIAVIAMVLADVAVTREVGEVAGPVGRLLRCGSVIPLTVTALLLLGGKELGRFFTLAGAQPQRRFALLMIGVMGLSPWLSAAGWLGDGPEQVEGLYWTVVWVFASIILSGILLVFRSDPAGALRDFAATMGMILYLGFLGSFTVQLRCARDIPGETGAWLLLVVLLVTKASDIGAFFAGSALGRHKLAPSVSPGKTIEGMVGGLVGSAATALVFAWVGSRAGTDSPDTDAGWFASFTGHLGSMVHDATRWLGTLHETDLTQTLLRAMLLGLALSAAGQFGDLIESNFKRDAHIKDSGRIMPWFGGILDLIDSPVVAIPVAWLLLTALWDVI